MHAAATNNRLGTVRVVDLRPGPTPRIGNRDGEHVQVLKESFDQLPPIVVHHDTMTVIDGAHRLLAAKMLGRTTIRVEFFTGAPEAAFVEAVQRNIKHGKPLTLVERREAARGIMTSHPEWSDARIASVCALSDKTVAELRSADRARSKRKDSDTRIGLDGRARPVDGSSRRLRAASILESSPTTSLRAVARAVELSPATVLDVRRRISRGESAVPQRTQATHGDRVGRNKANLPKTPLAVMTEMIDSISWISNPCSLDTVEQREFATWFRQRVQDTRSFIHFVNAVPVRDHRAVVILARVQARLWARFATEVERRLGRVDPSAGEPLLGSAAPDQQEPAKEDTTDADDVVSGEEVLQELALAAAGSPGHAPLGAAGG